MAKVELHDLNEYHLFTGALDVAGAAETIAYIAIPQAGQVKRVSACIAVVQTTAPANITFEIKGLELEKGGATATLIIPSAGSTLGDVETIDFDPAAAVNYGLEAEDGDAIAAGSVLAIVTDAGGAAGFANFMVTIGR